MSPNTINCSIKEEASELTLLQQTPPEDPITVKDDPFEDLEEELSTYLRMPEPKISDLVSLSEIKRLSRDYRVSICDYCNLTKSKICCDKGDASVMATNCATIWDYDRDRCIKTNRKGMVEAR